MNVILNDSCCYFRLWNFNTLPQTRSLAGLREVRLVLCGEVPVSSPAMLQSKLGSKHLESHHSGEASDGKIENFQIE